ncbi:MAG: helix-turn-helix domain-containing protein [Clostridiales Family XIII bacterium]|uniref:helix-turn-helix domain-containing protein n=1 Tax=Hominibacterium faecale TaxID=2839743 RepID=UPI0022B2A8F4|nr:helix-turn-helix domain-containing protein [Hominibacterium faecale]MCI7304500.1 helix-turn-helix domain-containing protein [Clostridia bacterium]MDY3013368.1 helix-turn-helix domain-containing protein [Clostridiales Family XIII bacterium]
MLLKQSTKCNQQTPLHMELLNINEHPWHMHDDKTMEIIYVLQGSLRCSLSIYSSILQAGDIAVVNTETLHHYNSSDDNIVLICHLYLNHFSSLMPEIENTLIICNSASAAEFDKHYELLKNAFAKTAAHYFNIKPPAQDELMDSCINFLSTLYNHFNYLAHDGASIRNENTMKKRPLQAERIKRVMHYIYENIAGNIRLEDIAAKEYISKYYLSHLISDFLSMPLRDYLGMVRAICAQDYLYATDMTLGEIASAVGFSSTEIFRKAYLKNTGFTPTEDRKRACGHTLNDIPLSDSDVLTYMDISDIAPFMHLKNVGNASVNSLENKSYHTEAVSISFCETASRAVNASWDTVLIEDPRQLLSFHTLGALSMLRDHHCFSKICVPKDSLLSFYSAFGSWDMIGTVLKVIKEDGFSLLIHGSDGNEFESLTGFSRQFAGPEIVFSPESMPSPGKFSNPACPISITAGHLQNAVSYPTLYKNKLNVPFMFDSNNLKTSAFYAYTFLNRMLPEFLYADDGCYVTRAENKAAILLYNNRSADEDGNGIQKYMFKLKHLERKYLYKSFIIDDSYESASAIFQNLALGKPADLELQRQLNIAAEPAMEVDVIESLLEYNLFLSSIPKTIRLIEIE